MSQVWVCGCLCSGHRPGVWRVGPCGSAAAPVPRVLAGLQQCWVGSLRWGSRAVVCWGAQSKPSRLWGWVHPGVDCWQLWLWAVQQRHCWDPQWQSQPGPHKPGHGTTAVPAVWLVLLDHLLLWSSLPPVYLLSCSPHQSFLYSFSPFLLHRVVNSCLIVFCCREWRLVSPTMSFCSV